MVNLKKNHQSISWEFKLKTIKRIGMNLFLIMRRIRCLQRNNENRRNQMKLLIKNHWKL